MPRVRKAGFMPDFGPRRPPTPRKTIMQDLHTPVKTVNPYDFTSYPKYQEILEKRLTHIRNAGFEEIVEPIDDQLVIRRFPDEEATAGGIIIPGKGEKQHRGVVLFAGPGKLLPDHTLEPMRIGVGDIVIFGHYAGINAISLNGEGLIVLRQSEITGMYRRKPVPAAVESQSDAA